MKNQKKIFVLFLMDVIHHLGRPYLSEILNVSPSAISQWLKEVTIPSSERLFTLAQAIKGTKLEKQWNEIKHIELNKNISSIYDRFKSYNLQDYILKDHYSDLSSLIKISAFNDKTSVIDSLFRLIKKLQKLEDGYKLRDVSVLIDKYIKICDNLSADKNIHLNDIVISVTENVTLDFDAVKRDQNVNNKGKKELREFVVKSEYFDQIYNRQLKSGALRVFDLDGNIEIQGGGLVFVSGISERVKFGTLPTGKGGANENTSRVIFAGDVDGDLFKINCKQISGDAVSNAHIKNEGHAYSKNHNTKKYKNIDK